MQEHRAVAQWDALQTAYKFRPGSQHDPNPVNLSCHKQSGNEGKDGFLQFEISVMFKQISTSTLLERHVIADQDLYL